MSPVVLIALVLIACLAITWMVLDAFYFRRLFHRLNSFWWFVLSVLILVVGNKFVALITRENLNEPVLTVIPSMLLFIIGGITIAVGFIKLLPRVPES